MTNRDFRYIHFWEAASRKFFILCMYIPDKWSMKSILSYRHKIFTQNGLRGALQKMLTTFFGIFGTPFLPYLLNHSSYRTEIFTQNRVRGALQKMSTTGINQNYFSISKNLKYWFSDNFQFFLWTWFWPYLLNHLSYRPQFFTQDRQFYPL